MPAAAGGDDTVLACPDGLHKGVIRPFVQSLWTLQKTCSSHLV